MLLGNDLTGNKVQADSYPNIIKQPSAPSREEFPKSPDSDGLCPDDSFPACAVTSP